MKHTLAHTPRLRVDTRLREEMDKNLVLVQRLGGSIANMRDQADKINAADVRDQALREAMAKAGTQQ